MPVSINTRVRPFIGVHALSVLALAACFLPTCSTQYTEDMEGDGLVEIDNNGEIKVITEVENDVQDAEEGDPVKAEFVNHYAADVDLYWDDGNLGNKHS